MESKFNTRVDTKDIGWHQRDLRVCSFAKNWFDLSPFLIRLLIQDSLSVSCLMEETNGVKIKDGIKLKDGG